ncbi:hypothetical protein F7018_05005 [Tenacibaculum aiptasiae]|uniref:Uncharacterized protein n=1 Tax=Tenacibaculum aiptasiae TaxID=426481 RepID=A0A7J5APY1_9FLAO|nr:hypothetical protein [Tenacibaculum aiptasiae]KAB1159671.1 hypothetical protein F7018_05005 [Tenacibaculum aiptasiae]
MNNKSKRKAIILIACSILTFIVGGLIRGLAFDIENIEKWKKVSSIGSVIQMIGVLLFFIGLFLISKSLNNKKRLNN